MCSQANASLAAKNAILIVEFAKQLEDRGMDHFAAAVEAAQLRCFETRRAQPAPTAPGAPAEPSLNASK